MARFLQKLQGRLEKTLANLDPGPFLSGFGLRRVQLENLHVKVKRRVLSSALVIEIGQKHFPSDELGMFPDDRLQHRNSPGSMALGGEFEGRQVLLEGLLEGSGFLAFLLRPLVLPQLLIEGGQFVMVERIFRIRFDGQFQVFEGLEKVSTQLAFLAQLKQQLRVLGSQPIGDFQLLVGLFYLALQVE